MLELSLNFIDSEQHTVHIIVDVVHADVSTKKPQLLFLTLIDMALKKNQQHNYLKLRRICRPFPIKTT